MLSVVAAAFGYERIPGGVFSEWFVPENTSVSGRLSLDYRFRIPFRFPRYPVPHDHAPPSMIGFTKPIDGPKPDAVQVALRVTGPC